MRSHVVRAVCNRNFQSYFSGTLGFLFILVFVIASATQAFSSVFFAQNVANLEQLTQWYPALLLFIVPAITMNIWAEERKQGTDELLFTLPATDVEVVIGKYLAVLSVYTVSLAFAGVFVIALMFLGEPDYWLLAANYVGYWLAGASLLTAGMVASVLTASSPVSFVLGVVFCATTIYLGELVPGRSILTTMSVPQQLSDFGLGLIPFGGLVYFGSCAIFMLYLNMVLVSKRHWKSGIRGAGLGVQFGIRATALLLILVSANVVLARFNKRLDFTSEKIYSLSDTTDQIIDDVERPILIQAFLSPEVPENLVSVRTTLRGLLRKFDQVGGDKIQVRAVETTPFSEEAEEAEKFGIQPRGVQYERGGRVSSEAIYMGVVVTGGIDDEVVIPFFDVGVPVEYELVRSIQTVSTRKRSKIGILETDAKLFGGFNMQAFSSDPEWRLVTELKKQYDVERVSPDAPISGDFKVLVAAMPSSLTDPQLDNLITYIKGGNPVLILDDPLPGFVNPGLAASQPKPRPGGPFGQGGPPPQPKGDYGKLIDVLGLVREPPSAGVQFGQPSPAWGTNLVWSQGNPHPQWEQVPVDWVFILNNYQVLDNFQEDTHGFNLKNPITNGLQEVLMVFPGMIQRLPDSPVKFEPLLRTSTLSGTNKFSDFMQQTMFGMQRREPQSRRQDSNSYAIAAHLSFKPEAVKKDEFVEDEAPTADQTEINVIFVSDLDFVSDGFFRFREARDDLVLDNVTFVLNAVDYLSGDDSFIELRKRRMKHRSLLMIESQTKELELIRAEEDRNAEMEAETKLGEANARLSKRVEDIRKNAKEKGLDSRTVDIMIQTVQNEEQRKLDVERAVIDREKLRRKDQARAVSERDKRKKERGAFLWILLSVSMPPCMLGLLVFTRRYADERRFIVPERLVRDVRK